MSEILVNGSLLLVATLTFIYLLATLVFPERF